MHRPERYSLDSYTADAKAVLDACRVEHVIAIGLSLGAAYALQLAASHPDVVDGLVLVGPALALAPPLPERSLIGARFHDPAPTDPEGWDRYNLAYWHAHYDDFVRWFCEQLFSEPHSTKAIDDGVAWASETGPEVLEAAASPRPGNKPMAEVLAELRCPTLVIHGSDDRVQSHAVGIEAARLSGGTLVTFEGSGHIPNLRDPVRFNLLVREFADRVAACAR